MATRRVLLKYPNALIKEPIVSRVVKQYDIEVNIRRARVTETLGEMALELDGEPGALDQAVQYLEAQGVQVEPLEGDLVSP